MTDQLLDSAMSHLRAVAAHSQDCTDSEDDGGLLAHAASRLLSSTRARGHAVEILRFAKTALAVPIDSMVKDIEKPTAHEIESVVKLLASREFRATPLQHRLACLCDILGLDGADLAILVAVAHYYRDEHLRSLINDTCGYGWRCLRSHAVAQISGIGEGRCKNTFLNTGDWSVWGWSASTTGTANTSKAHC